MEAFIVIHSPELIFVGKAPSSSDQYSKHFCLVKGMSATAFCRGQLRSKQVMSRKGSRTIADESHVSRLLKSLRHLTDDVEVDAEAVSKMLTTVSQKTKRSGALTSLFNQWNQTHRLTKVQLLAIVRQGVANEQPMLHFDYVAMHHRCRQLLTRIRSELGSDLDCTIVSTKMKELSTSEMTLPVVLASILYQLTAANRGGNAVPLVKASGILKDVVEREGGEEMRKMNLKGKRHGWLAECI
ncbi:MAG: hypothetical protein ALECFALPRED_004603 [Alectoria fallacina]|uniref:Uncharacterized protein n=1 Tax=Alectoria fallacina TaxID=1903189 RepID=A0A8H3FWB8_9LECA|nr:MAG: hypothetical protein ALECFALPRED_004603 [Alectoria fallacina]